MIAYPAASIQYRRTLAGILAGYAIAVWDAEVGITITGAGVSQHDNPIGGWNLLQATDADRPIYTAAGPQSYYNGAGQNRKLVTAVGTSLSGGDLCLISVAKFNVTPGTSKTLLGLGSTTTIRSSIRTNTVGSNFGARLDDSTGIDSMVGPASDAARHCQILYNSVGVRRTFWVDGGAGTAGARTTAVFGVHDVVGVLCASQGGGQASAQASFHAVCLTAPPLAVINRFGFAAQERFGGFTWTPAT